ncbi:MAG: D-glycerate dehydrogenase [Chloroflexi bacterium]|nr:D-glycerate dehydrogenase [Chloroflexota bacterium]
MSNRLPLVLISHALPDDWIKKLEGCCQIAVGPPEANRLSTGLMQRLPDAVGILTLLTIPVTEEMLAKTPHLRVVSNMAVGYDNIDIPACTRRGIPVGNTPGVLTEGTADMTMALLLAAARKLPQASQDARAGRWTTWSPTGWLGADLHGATLGIIGMGKIGAAVARRAAAFGMKIIYASPSQKPEVETDLLAMRKSFDEVLAESDFLSLHCPLTEATRSLIDAATLRAMKPSAILINAARGPVIVSADLEHALREKWIAAAALDVTDPEPLPPDHPLYQLPNCLIAPHIGSATQYTRKRMAELACENLLAGLRQERLPHCINPEVYQ